MYMSILTMSIACYEGTILFCVDSDASIVLCIWFPLTDTIHYSLLLVNIFMRIFSP